MKLETEIPEEATGIKTAERENPPRLYESVESNSPDNQDIWEHTLEHEAERIHEDISENWANYHDDPPGDVLVDENPEAPNGMFGDHEDDFDIG